MWWSLEGADTDRERALEFLAEAGAVLASSLDYDTTLSNVAEIAVPYLADWVAVDLLEPDGSLRRIAVAHADPARAAEAAQFRKVPPDASSDSPVARALHEGASRLFATLDADWLDSTQRHDEHRALLESIGFVSEIVVPLVARQRTLGAMSLATAESGRRYGRSQLLVAEQLATRAALAVDNARLHREAREAEQRLRQLVDDLRYSHALLRAQNEASLDGTLVVSLEGEMVQFNQRFVDLWGIPQEVVRTRSNDAALAAVLEQLVDRDGFLARIAEVQSGAPSPVFDELALRDGRVIERYGAPLRDEDGEFYGWAWSFHDATQRIRAAEERNRSAERFERLATTLQQSLLPPHLPTVPGLTLAARYLPAGRGLEVGGDFYDVFPTGRRHWGLVIGDVCGKGAEAAAVTALARYTVRAAAAQSSQPSRVLALLNEVMLREALDERFVTVLYATLTPGDGDARVRVAAGGHPLPLLLRAHRYVGEIGVPGSLVGVLADVSFVDTDACLRRGDALVLVTDGVLEARDAGGQELGVEGLANVLRANAGAPAEQIAAAVESAVRAHQQGALRDDTAVLVVGVDA